LEENKLPKIVVVVEKDEAGRLWDYVLPEQNQFEAPRLLIHNSPLESASLVELPNREDDMIEIGVLPVSEKICTPLNR
jgi:hypothetical protein